MKKYHVFETVNHNSVPHGTKLLDYTWAMKKKSSGTYRARLALRGFKQVEGQHYKKNNTSSPVITDIAIRVVLALIILSISWVGRITDVQGSFLHGSFQRPSKRIYTKVPQGLRHLYPPHTILLLLITMYGSIQGALQWWRDINQGMTFLQWNMSTCNPCLH